MNVSRFGRGLVIAGGLVAAVTVVASLWLTGSPGAQRDARLDTVRVRDLRAIEQAAGTHLRENGALPAKLADVPGADLRRVDPVTGAAYGYRVIAPDGVELCAVFAADNGQPLRQIEPWVRRDWPHVAGPACFERRLDRPSRAEG
ncbi:hypothetical protein [Luteimonas sp. 3794]|uniref:hypothetical protein n=1 Tax=Luteimonas sp. 3794 TaxID=2817730 RepID=UPI00285567F5|nr:hypothetical protein [Luteimonas sp. 3794]MDR6992129.1 hypothetical protein [Luteimonas sp. 3794]